MSRLFKILMASILALFILACGLISGPVADIEKAASTAESFASAIPGRYDRGTYNSYSCTNDRGLAVRDTRLWELLQSYGNARRAMERHPGYAASHGRPGIQ